MSFTFKPATRENLALLIGLAGPTGSGKSYTAMELASGLAGERKWCVIDTEAGRAKHYADRFTFDHGDLRPPFRPKAYEDAIMAADAAGYAVIVVDSASHEHAGEGGILEMQEAELDRMAGDDWKKREACKMAAWIKPKTEHKHFVQKLLQFRAHLILCFRAEEKIEMVRENGKMVIKPKQTLIGADGFVPICEKNLPYELTLSLLLKADRPGFPHPIKLQEQHKAMIPLDRPIGRSTGEALAKWAGGETPAAPTATLNPLLKDVLDAIEASTTQGELQSVAKQAAALPDNERTAARDVFKIRKKKIDDEKALADAALEAERTSGEQ